MLIFSANEAAAAPGDKGTCAENGAQAKDLGMQEYRADMSINVKARQSRLFQVKNKIVRTAIGNPHIAEPVVVTMNHFYLLGKKEGRTSLSLWDDTGGVVHMNVRVEKQENLSKSGFNSLRDDFFRKLSSRHSESKIDTFTDHGAVLDDECDHNGKIDSNHLRISQTSQLPQLETLKNTDRKESKVNVLSVPRFPKADQNFIPGLVEVTIVSDSRNVQNSLSPSRLVEISLSQFRVFRTENNIAKVVTGNTDVAEPVVVSTNEFILLAKSPGRTAMTIHDHEGNSKNLAVLVINRPDTFKSKFKRIGEVVFKIIPGVKKERDLSLPYIGSTVVQLEHKATRVIDLKLYQPRTFKIKSTLANMSIADNGIVEPVVVSANEIALLGRSPGRTTLFLWSDTGSIEGLELRVSADSDRNSKRSEKQSSSVACDFSSSPAGQSKFKKNSFPVHEIECWRGNSKEVVHSLSSEDSVLAGCDPIISDIPDIYD